VQLGFPRREKNTAGKTTDLTICADQLLLKLVISVETKHKIAKIAFYLEIVCVHQCLSA
jgi:hypothetical protein